MSALTIQNHLQYGATMVSNDFIDHYIAEASGEFVKVYLCLLRHQTDPAGVSISMLADCLNHTEKDVIRALKYWEKMQLIRLTYGDGKQLSGITLLDVSPESESIQPASAPPATQSSPSSTRPEQEAAVSLMAPSVPDGSQPAPPAPSVSIDQLKGDEEFSQLLYIAEQYIGATLSRRDCDIFANLYGGLHMSFELLEYLIESCVSAGHMSVRYMEAVALNWHKSQITTVEKAKAYSAMYRKDEYAVLKAFGLSSRNPGAAEHTMMDKWFSEYGFSLDIVLEACNRTIAATHKPSFDYANKILAEWYKKGVKSQNDIKAADEKRRAAKPEGKTAPVSKSNKFHNFEQRTYDYDALLQQINANQ